jgi:hypothetical protein
MTSVSAAVADDGRITWTINATAGSLTPGMSVWILIDADGNTADGWHGADKAIAVEGPDGAAQFYSWNGSAFAPQAGSGLSASGRFPLDVTLDAAAIGSVSSVSFFVRTIVGNDYDDAPGGSYASIAVPQTSGSTGGGSGSGGGGSAGVPPPPPPPPPPPTHASGPSGSGGDTASSGASGSQSSGGSSNATTTRTLAAISARSRVQYKQRIAEIRYRIIDDGSGAAVTAGRIACSARSGGARLRVLTAGFVHGVAVCRFRLGRSARLAIVGKATVRSGGGTLILPFRIAAR